MYITAYTHRDNKYTAYTQYPTQGKQKAISNSSRADFDPNASKSCEILHLVRNLIISLK